MIVAIIPAKGESKRLEDKNLKAIQGKSLLAWAIDYARTSKKVAAIYVSTDDERVERAARECGTEVVRRGMDLSEAPLFDVYRHALENIKEQGITHIVGIQPDNPDRTARLDEIIDYVLKENIDDLFTLDSTGHRNGALRILSVRALRAQPPISCHAILENTTNIHNPFGFRMAARNLSAHKESLMIGNRRVGPNEPAFIVAEAACNHMCDMNLARRMIDEAAAAGVDAVKFQTYKAEELVTKNAVAFWGEERITQMEYYKRLDRFEKVHYEELFNYARQKGIIAFSSPFDAESADMLATLDMPVFKIASCDICNLEHLRRIARYNKPVILATGASSMEEVERAVTTIFEQGNYQLILLACTLSYPTKFEDANFLRIVTLRKNFPGMIIGVSDHTEPDAQMVVPAVAVSLGSKVVEKHYTLDRRMTGSGHFFATDPQSLKKMVENIRLTELIMGDGSLGVALSEEKAWKSARRSIVAKVRIRAGQVITEDMLGLKRPGDGLQGDMMDKVIGKKAKVDIGEDEKISLEFLQD